MSGEVLHEDKQISAMMDELSAVKLVTEKLQRKWAAEAACLRAEAAAMTEKASQLVTDLRKREEEQTGVLAQLAKERDDLSSQLSTLRERIMEAQSRSQQTKRA